MVFAVALAGAAAGLAKALRLVSFSAARSISIEPLK
jgi:hypothetical protein